MASGTSHKRLSWKKVNVDQIPVFGGERHLRRGDTVAIKIMSINDRSENSSKNPSYHFRPLLNAS